MAWVDPTTRTTGTLITASIWNADIVDNLMALKDPPTDLYEINEGSDYTTTSTTFVDVDAAGDPDLSLTIVTTGGDVMVGFFGSVSGGAGNQRIAFDVTMDSVRMAGDDGFVAMTIITTVDVPHPIGFVHLETGLAAGSHTFVLQWKTSASTATLGAGAGSSNYRDVHPEFWVREAT